MIDGVTGTLVPPHLGKAFVLNDFPEVNHWRVLRECLIMKTSIA